MKPIFIFLAGFFLTISNLQAQYEHRKLVPSQYPTIQSAIVAASPGDTVLVDDSTYKEQINFLGKKPLVVASNYILTGDTNHIYNTIIDGSDITSYDTGSIVSFKSGEDTTSVLCGFTIQNGNHGVTYSFPPDIIRVAGAIYISTSGAKIMYNRIINNSLNSATGGGTIVIGAGIGTHLDTCANWVVIDHNTFSNDSCQTTLNQAGGAAITMTYNSIIKNNVIKNNYVKGVGGVFAFGAGFFIGGLADWTIPIETHFYNNLVVGNVLNGAGYNSANGAGGSFQAIKAFITSNIFQNNTILSSNSLGNGGGLSFVGTREGTVINNNTFKGNYNPGNGGGLLLTGNTSLFDLDTALVENNYFLNNTSGNGGGIYSDFRCHRFENNIFQANEAETWGGGICFVNAISGPPHGSLGLIINCSFSENHTTAPDGMGGAIFSFKSKPVVVNSIFRNDSSATAEGKEIGVSIASDILLGKTGAGDTLEIAYSDIDTAFLRGPYLDGAGNINEDPLYDGSDTLYLLPGSPCVDAGTSGYTMKNGKFIKSPDLDIHGKKRPNATYYDMGAYELPPYAGIRTFNTSVSALGNFPNPFGHSTTIFYSLPRNGQVSLTIVNLSGNVIAELLDAYQSAGNHSFTWDSENLSPGIYLCRLEAGGKVTTCKLAKQ